MAFSGPIHNLLLSLATLVFVDRAVSFVNWIEKRGYLTILQARKLIHLSATSTVFGWPLFDESHWTWRLASLTCGLYSAKLLVRGVILPNPDDTDFLRNMTRSGKSTELCQGPLLFASIIFCVCNFAFKTDIGTYIIAAMGVGDGIAPLVGSAFPWISYTSFGGERKTMSGSIAMFVGTLTAIPVLGLMIGAPKPIELVHVVSIALFATIAEAVSGPWDNMAVPLTIYLYTKLAAV